MAAPLLLAALLVAGNAAHACLIPPRGCTADVCNRYTNMIIPGTGNFNSKAAWKGEIDKLAFVRSAFNRNLGPRGPAPFTSADGAARWLNLYDTYPEYGYEKLPALNYEWYEVNGQTVKEDATPVPGFPDPNANIAACCHACRLTTGCPMYIYLPATYTAGTKVQNGKCFFVKTGGTQIDGPFQWTNVSDKTSARTVNVGGPRTLAKAKGTARFGKGQLGLSAAFPDPDYALVFAGGFCNPNTHPNGSITDDPHFMGAHGTRFDFNGELDKAFCLISDRSLHLNAVLKGYTSDNAFGATEGSDGKALRSWIKEIGLMWTDAANKKHSLHLVARGGKDNARGDGFLSAAVLDGKPISALREAGSSLTFGGLTLSFLGTTKTGWYDLDRYSLRIGSQLDLSLNMRVAHPKLQTPSDAEVHFNIMVNEIKVTDAVHGVLGQTYRNTPSQMMKAVKYSALSRLLGGPVKADGASGAGFLEGSVADYEASNVLSTDCKMSAFV